MCFVDYSLRMKSGPFIKTVSSAYRVEEKTVTLFARFLKEAGHMTSTIRGANAPHMQPRDLAVLTTALLTTERAAWCVDAFQCVARMQLSTPEQHRFIEQGIPDPNHTFLDLMTYLCDPALPVSKAPEFSVEITGTTMATIKRNGLTLVYIDRAETERMMQLHAKAEKTNDAADFSKAVETSPMNAQGIVTTREISSATLQIAKSIIFGEEG